uniref:Uncharacterized protein n=1 Tax=Anguilla anguilla TaxID=7936 RepID=A0A0E9RUE4_ANGAN
MLQNSTKCSFFLFYLAVSVYFCRGPSSRVFIIKNPLHLGSGCTSVRASSGQKC